MLFREFLIYVKGIICLTDYNSFKIFYLSISSYLETLLLNNSNAFLNLSTIDISLYSSLISFRIAPAILPTLGLLYTFNVSDIFFLNLKRLENLDY